jgi:large subunit ribosomal protein L25
MSESTVLTVHPRTLIGKSSTRLAPKGLIPAVLYGMNREALPIALDRHEFELFMGHHSSGSTLVEMQIEGEKKPVNAMIREMQISPIKGNIVHVDFLAVSLDVAIHAVVPLRYINDPAGVKAGGVLTVDKHEVNVEAKPAEVPETIEVDVAALEVGDSLHVRDLVAPAGVKVLDDEDAILASVTPPTVAVEDEESTESAEPEVIGAKSEEA